jgi:hypothetical protein
MKYLNNSFRSIILYALFGFTLGAAGVGIVNKPFEFLAIMFIVIGIDINSAYTLWKSMEDV